MSDDEESVVRRRLSRLFDPGARGEPDRPTFDLLPGESTTQRHGRRSRAAQGSSGPRSDAIVQPATGPTEAAPPGEPEQEPPGSPSAQLSRLPGPGAFDPGRRGVRALAVVAAVVVLIAALWAWRSRPHAEPVRPVAAAAAPDGPQPCPAASPGATAQLVVAVAGKVRRPGLVRLPAGARVADAVEAAGGALPGVDIALLNPARKVTDGELILVGVTAPPGQAVPPGQGGQPAAGAAPGGPVNLNTATLAQLDALPGVGPVLAQRILDHREQHGGFRSVSDLRQVDGIGDARYEQLKDLVTV
ncbi:helix-hairpin-helix domain-containing protein [Micromonospora soli]|uniref:helix-hairpin-helix domain-containing protein n=1 Tax=Micromonospora sp. NBRC 110009 TaxID=3061627 RepID=UPI002670FD3E|nr:helix-hairpin-helix domain-containing protein [Micromonospora sp. NBRC 110009]WKT96124.1 helix-hairpin-helix domain-containing protein [Micromonospora sp. NBRC 110009]